MLTPSSISAHFSTLNFIYPETLLLFIHTRPATAGPHRHFESIIHSARWRFPAPATLYFAIALFSYARLLVLI
jgi:hypothetical protein